MVDNLNWLTVESHVAHSGSHEEVFLLCLSLLLGLRSLSRWCSALLFNLWSMDLNAYFESPFTHSAFFKSFAFKLHVLFCFPGICDEDIQSQILFHKISIRMYSMYLFLWFVDLQPWLLCSGWSKKHFWHRLTFRDYSLDQHWDIAKNASPYLSSERQKANMCIACVFCALLLTMKFYSTLIALFLNFISTYMLYTWTYHWLNSSFFYSWR